MSDRKLATTDSAAPTEVSDWLARASVNLDYNATTPIHPEVIAAIHDCYLRCPGNAASPHSLGRQAKSVLEQARERIAELLGARLSGHEPDQLLLTSGGTEANNLAMLSLAGTSPGRIVLSKIEHPSVLEVANVLSRRGYEIAWSPAQPLGTVDMDAFTARCSPDTCCACLMLANNETGVIQPVQALAEQVDDHILFHTDAVQAVGKIKVDFRSMNVSTMSFSAHKFHGPVGIGGLIVKHGVNIEPLLHGGGQQIGLRPGTEPVALAVGMCKALEIWHENRNDTHRRVRGLREQFEAILRQKLPWIVIHGSGAPRLAQTTNVSFPGLDRQALLMALDLAGVACSTGSACSSGASEPSSVLTAMGCPEELIQSSLRFSLGSGIGTSEVALAASRICKVAMDLRP